MIPLTRPLVDFAEVAEAVSTIVGSGRPASGEVVEQVVAQLREVVEGGA